MNLAKKLQQNLRRKGHKLKPVVMIGNAGLTDSVLREIDLSLEHHELIKVKINAADRLERDAIIEKICGQSSAVLVQRIGNIVENENFVRHHKMRQRFFLR